MSGRRQGHPAGKPWRPMQQGTLSDEFVRLTAQTADQPDEDEERMEVWSNDLYECIVRIRSTGAAHLSIKRYDRAAIHDWRHLQSIKNEVLGDEREAVEVYPAESRLIDTANEYHLWALPEGVTLPWGGAERIVAGPDAVARENERVREITGKAGRGRQRPWQPGLSTGLGS